MPPCTACSSLMNMNYAQWTDEQINDFLTEARVHVHVVLSMYELQLKAGRNFLHENPATATPWRDPVMVKFRAHSKVQTDIGDQCQYGLTTPDGKGGRKPCVKPTRVATSNHQMIERLSRRCPEITNTNIFLVEGKKLRHTIRASSQKQPHVASEIQPTPQKSKPLIQRTSTL